MHRGAQFGHAQAVEEDLDFGLASGRRRADVSQSVDGAHTLDGGVGQEFQRVQAVAADFDFDGGAEREIRRLRESELKVGHVGQKLAHRLDDVFFRRDCDLESHVELGGVFFLVRGRAAGLAAAADQGEDRGYAVKGAAPVV